MLENFCIECGEKFKSNEQKFCGMCGTPTSQAEATSSQEVTGINFVGSGPSGLSPFAPLTREFVRQEFQDFSEGVFSFHHANLTLVQATARTWFPGEYDSAQEITSGIESEIKPEWINDYEVNQWFTDGDNFFSEYEPIAWEDSTLGKRFLSALDARGVVYSQGSLGVFVEVAMPNGKTEVLPFSKQIQLVSGQWGLSDGTPYLQKGEVFRSIKTGKDIVFWNIDALATTRPRTNIANIAYSKKLLIPQLLQVATYLAETAFPAALSGSMGMAKRENSFGENSTRLPRPATRHLLNGRAIGLSRGENGSQTIAAWAPDVWQHGYIFDESMSEEDIYGLLPTVCDGLPKIADLLVDGYCNWLPGSQLDFQVALWSDFALIVENDYFSHGAIVPGVLYWELSQRSISRYEEACTYLQKSIESNNTENIDEAMYALQVVAQEGVGSIFLHAGNSWASSGMDIYGGFVCTPVMEFFSDIDVDSQGINALSNLIVWHIKFGSIKEAEPFVDQAVLRTERIGPNIETHSYFQPIDGSAEIPIYIEIYESAITIKKELGKIAELKAIAEKAIAYCEKNAPDAELLVTAREILK